jgi:hypothetical protein
MAQMFSNQKCNFGYMYFGGPWNEKSWYILWLFGIYITPFGIFFGYLVS